MFTTPDPARTTLVVEKWADLPVPLQSDCTLYLGPGVRYHVRQDLVFVVASEVSLRGVTV